MQIGQSLELGFSISDDAMIDKLCREEAQLESAANRDQRRAGARSSAIASRPAMVMTKVVLRARAMARRNWALLAVVGICVFAVLLRCVHLLDGSHYYIVSPDSHYFHWRAVQHAAGERFPMTGSGLVLPVVYVAKGLSLVFRLSTSASLDLTGKLLPPVLSVVTMLMLYWGVRKIYDRNTALLSAFAWAGLPILIFFGAAGYLDRDMLSVALVMLGVFAFYFSKDWKLAILRVEVGWAAAVTAVLATELLLYLEWKYAGPAILLGILGSYFSLRILVSLIQSVLRVISVVLPVVKTRPAIPPSRSEWKAFAAVVLANSLFAVVFYERFALYVNYIMGKLAYVGMSNVSEMRGLGSVDIMQYGVFLVPIAIGLFLLAIRWSPRNLLLLSWFGFCAVLSVFANRILPFAAPALSVIVGVGLAGAISWARTIEPFQGVKWIAVGLLTLALGVNSLYFAGSFAQYPWISVHRDWEDALTYLREETAPGSVVMSWWDSGYWIRDLGDRTPVVDNGDRGYTESQLQDIASAYCTPEPAQAAAIMRKYWARYLIFSDLDRTEARSILEHAGLEEYLTLPPRSLATLSLNGSFKSGGGLEVVYRNSGVSILALSKS